MPPSSRASTADCCASAVASTRGSRTSTPRSSARTSRSRSPSSTASAFTPLRDGARLGQEAGLRLAADHGRGAGRGRGRGRAARHPWRGPDLLGRRRRRRLDQHRLPPGRPPAQRRLATGRSSTSISSEAPRDTRRVLRRCRLQRLSALPVRQRGLPRRPARGPRRAGVRPVLRLPDAARARRRDRGCGARGASSARVSTRRTRASRAGMSPRRGRRSRHRWRRHPTSDFVYSAIGHGHLDMAWLWPLRETRRKAARTYTRALNTIEDRDGYLYGTSQPQQMYWMKHEQPAIFERLEDGGRRRTGRAAGLVLGGARHQHHRGRIAGAAGAGRPTVSAGGVRAERRRQLRLCWLPDTFGYNGNLPQILKKSGMDWFQTIKLAWNKVNDFPHRTFNWEGIDGSSVLVHMPPEGDYNSRARGRRAAARREAVPGARPEHGAAGLRLRRRRRRARRDAPRADSVARRTCAGSPGSSTRRRATSSAGSRRSTSRTPTSASCTSRPTRARTRRRARSSGTTG